MNLATRTASSLLLALLSGCAVLTVSEDELHRGASLLKALDELAVQTLVLRAPRGLFNEPGGLYAPGYLDTWAEKLPALTVREIPNVNHYTIVMGGAGAAAVADTVRVALAVA